MESKTAAADAAPKSDFKPWEREQARRVLAGPVSKLARPVTLGTIILGVFVGNVLTAVVLGIVYAVLTAK